MLIDPRICLDIIKDVSIFHPRCYDTAKWRGLVRSHQWWGKPTYGGGPSTLIEKATIGRIWPLSASDKVPHIEITLSRRFGVKRRWLIAFPVRHRNKGTAHCLYFLSPVRVPERLYGQFLLRKILGLENIQRCSSSWILLCNCNLAL